MYGKTSHSIVYDVCGMGMENRDGVRRWGWEWRMDDVWEVGMVYGRYGS